MGVNVLREYVRTVLGEGHKRFDMEVFRKLKGIPALDEYLLTHAKKLGLGASRSAWDTGHGYVIKIAHGEDDKWQNEHEANLHACSGRSIVVPAVLARSRDYLWIAVEKVKPVTGVALDAAVKKMTGTKMGRFDLNKLMSLVNYYSTFTKKGDRPPSDSVNVFKTHEELLTKNDWYRELFRLVDKKCIEVNELHDENWGVRSSGVLVLLDPGL